MRKAMSIFSGVVTLMLVFLVSHGGKVDWKKAIRLPNRGGEWSCSALGKTPAAAGGESFQAWKFRIAAGAAR